MAIQKPNSRRLLNKDEEDERKASEKFFLPTLEELTAIEEKAKEDAAAAVSSQMADPMRNRNDLGRVAMQDAMREMLAEHENAVSEQKQKVERAKQEYEAYPVIDRVGLGSSSLMADIARDNIKKQENEYDRMTMTEPEYAKKHKADFGESVEQIVQSAGYGAAKSFGQAADVISATGAGLKSAGKWLGGEGDDESSAAKEFARGFQNRLADTEKSLYDEIDAEYQRERQRNAKVNGELNVFAGYVDQAAHSVGEQALMFWTASMSSALFGGAKAFTAISSKADDLAKSGKKGMQMIGQALGKINAGSVGGATSMFITSSAQSTKEAILDMRQQNEEAAAYGMPKKYTDDEIEEKAALYGFLNGVSEVGLEYAIGGVTGAAGSIMPKGKVKNPFLTAVLSYLKGSAGEGFEESVQTLASTGLKRAVYDQTAEVDWREVLDSGIVGMLTGVGMGAPSFIRNTSIGVSAMRDVSNTAKVTNRVNTDAQAGVVASVSAAKAKAYGQMAEQVRNTDSENADTIASIYAWAADRQQEIADAMADDTKRKKIIDENTKDTRAAIQRMRDTNPDFAETERTGLASGANVDDIRMAGELSSVLGKKVRFFREDAKNGTINNGEYHEDTGEIWINTRSKNVKAQIVAHELTHSIEKNDGYRQLVDLTMNKLEAEQKAKGKTLDDLYREKETLYADGGVRLASYDEITSELVAEFVEKRLLTDEASIKSLVGENRTLGQRIREWFDSLLAKMGNASAKEREYIRQMRDMYARALGENVSAETSADGKVRHSFVGESANVDKSQLAVAKQMEADGKTDEEIYAETGWYKQSDGKWRTEIPDEIMIPENFSRTGLQSAKDAEADRYLARIKADLDDGVISEEVYTELEEFAEGVRGKDIKNGKLPSFLNAPQLYEAYPQLKKVNLTFRKISAGQGYSDIGQNQIVLDPEGLNDAGLTVREGLAHEIQHFIQNIEGFASGSSPEAAGSYEAYRKAGGEIEARDVEDRLRMSEEARRGKMPVRFSVSRADGEAVRMNTPGVKDAEEAARINEEIERVDSVTEAETDQTLQQIRNDIAADEARYRELSDTVMSNERFNAMMPDEQNAILDEMQSLRERIDRANQIMQDMSYEQDMGDDVPVPTDGDVPAEDDSYHGMKAMNHPGDDAPAPTDEDVPEQVKRNGKLKEMPDAGDDVPMPTDGDAPVQEKRRKGLTAEKAEEHLSERQKKRGERKTVAKAETAFKRLGYDIAGAIVDNYEDAAGIIEDDKIASRVESDINKYVEDNNIQFYVDNTAKLMALGQLKPENVGLKGEDLKHAKLLADMYRQFEEVSGNSIREQGKKNTNIINEELDDIFRGYDWFTEPDKKQKRLREQLQLSLANPEQVMRDVFGDAKIVKDEDGNERLLNVAERLNEYIIRPTIENSARARRQTNQMVSGLRSLGLTEAESGITQIFAEYSDIEESKSKKPTISESDLRYMLMTKMDADGFAEQIARKEYGQKETKEKKEFRDSIVEQLQNEINVNEAKARQRALRDHKAKGGTNASWNALSETERNAKIEAAYKTVTDESIGRIVNGTKELRKLLDDMYEAINAVSVIHGAAPIPFRRGYMPHSHNQTEQLQKWFNDHMGGLNVTPVQDLPTDIAGKTADRKPNKRWFSHAQERTGPRTTWDALGNIEDYLRIANDTIYHMDDIRKMRVLERYIRGIYSVARGATGEEQRTRVRNDVMQRLHGEEVDLVFLGLQPPEKKQKISDEDMDLSQMTTFVTWLTNYTNDLAAKQIFNRDIESFAGRKVNNLANTLTSWSSRTMMQYNISSNLKQLSQLGTVSGDVGARISKDAAAMTLRSMQNLGNGTNELEQKYHISERSTFLAEKEAIEEATFASDKDLTEKQKTDRQNAKDIWDYAWSMTDTTMSRYAVYAYFMEGMQRGMDDTAALHYADTKARNILASRMKGSSPLIFQSKNPILRMFTLFQREPLAAWQDILKTMPREYKDMKIGTDEKTAKEQITKRITGRLLGAGIVNTVYATVLGLGTPAMFDILGEPIRALLDKLWKEITPDEEDDITFKEMAERYISTLGDEIADDIPFANVVSLISNTYAGTEFESRLALNAPDLRKIFGIFGLGGKAAWNGAKLLWSDDAEDIELLEELSTIPGQIPVTILDMITEIVGTAAPAGNQIRKSAKGLIAVLRSGEYTKDGKLKYEVGGVGDSIRAVLLGSSNTRAGQEWIATGFDSLSKTETEAYKALIGAGVSEKRARQYVERVAEAEKVADETQAQAEARMIDRMTGLDKQQKAELYYDMVATDNQRAAVDAAVGAGAKIDDAVETARAIRDSSKKIDRLTALQASDMDTDAREEMYLAMVATKIKDTDGNVIGTEDDDLLESLYATGLDFDDFLDAKQMQSVLNANESLTANQRASRFLAWTASQGYTDAQADVIGENFGFSSGFRVKSETYQKIVDNGVHPDNAVKVTDAIAGKTKTADKINAVWSTGLTGNQLDIAVKSVLSEKAYERYRIVVDANIPLEIYTWALLNADQDAEGEKGHGSVNNTERELILSQLALPRKDLSALWLALGGSEKSNPYSGTSSGGMPKVSVPKVEVPKIEMPKIELPKIGG